MHAKNSTSTKPIAPYAHADNNNPWIMPMANVFQGVFVDKILTSWIQTAHQAHGRAGTIKITSTPHGLTAWL